MSENGSESQRRNAQEISRAVLENRLSIIEGARELSALAHTDVIRNEEDRRTVIGVDSETDHLPVGEVRKYWATDSLKEKDIEIAGCEELYRRRILDVCRRILDQDEGTV